MRTLPADGGYLSVLLDGDTVVLRWKGELPKAAADAVEQARAIAPVRVEPAAYSYAELDKAAQQVADTLLVDSSSWAHTVTILGDGIGLRVGTEAQAAARSVPEAGVPIEVVTSGELGLLTRVDDSAPWWGGSHMNNANGNGNCSSAFPVTNSTGGQWMLTAAHCGTPGLRHGVQRHGRVACDTLIRQFGHEPGGDRRLPARVNRIARSSRLGVGGVMRADAKTQGDVVEFIATRSASLLRSAWLLTGDRHKAEDLLQTVLAELWVRHGRGGIDSVDAYARRMLYTTYLTWWRRRWRFEVPTRDVPDRDHGQDLADDVSRRTVVESGLARLSRRQRAVLVLRFFEDRSVEATAALLGCSSGAVKTHTSRALAVLRDDESLRDLIRRGGER